MKRYGSKRLLLIYQLLILFLEKILVSKCSCEKETPIFKKGQCQSIFCTQKEFENNICSIENEIRKNQWLNNFIIFDKYRYRFTKMVINSKGELILETSPEEVNGQRLFFRLKANGRSFFKNENNEEILSKSINVLDDNNNGAIRYESQIFLIKVKNDNFDENKEYLVSISLYYGYMEIYDLDNENIQFSKILVEDFGNYIIYSRKGSIINLNNKEYLYFFLGQSKIDWQYYIVLKKFIFYDNNINKNNVNEKCLIEDVKKSICLFQEL
jgi:hypothetical protein